MWIYLLNKQLHGDSNSQIAALQCSMKTPHQGPSVVLNLGHVLRTMRAKTNVPQSAASLKPPFERIGLFIVHKTYVLTVALRITALYLRNFTNCPQIYPKIKPGLKLSHQV